MTAPLTCPYCNAGVVPPPGAPAGWRVTCPRCGDAFRLREPVPGNPGDLQVGPPPPGSPTGIQKGPSSAGVGRPRRWTNRRVAAGVLTLMACMAGAGLALALWTQKDRRAHDTGIAAKPRRAPPREDEPLPPPEVVAPARLEALGYLPGDAGLVLGVHVAELLDSPMGKQALHVPLKFGKRALSPELIVQLTGLKAENLDHAVLGAKITAALPPPVWLVARGRHAIDRERFRKDLEAQQVAGAGPRTVYRYTSRQIGLPVVAAFLDDRTVAFALEPEQLARVPNQPHEDISNLGPEIRQILRERLQAGSPIWVVAHPEGWARLRALPALVGLSPKALDLLSSVLTFGAWVEMGNPLTVKAALHCKDARAAQALDGSVHTAAQNLPDLKTNLNDDWLDLQLRLGPEALGQLLAPERP